MIVESKPGAAGSIGMEYAARQPNDGYSFVIGNIGPAAVNPLMTKVPYDVERDFVAISLILIVGSRVTQRSTLPWFVRTNQVAFAAPAFSIGAF